MSASLPWPWRTKEFYIKAINHPSNASVVRFLRSHATPLLLSRVIPWSELAFGASVHPDLSTLLGDVAAGLPEHYLNSLYGFEAIANPAGVLCSFGYRIQTLAFRLPEQSWQEALDAGGESLAELDEGWIEFNPWQPKVSEKERVELYRHWCRRAYDYVDELT